MVRCLSPRSWPKSPRSSAPRPRSAPEVRVAADSHLVDDLAIDSLDLVGVFLKVQDHFDLAIDDDDVPTLLRVSDLARYVSDHRHAAA